MARIRLLALVLLAVTCSCSKVGDLDDKLQGEVKKTEVSGGNKPTVQVSMRAARAFAETLILEDGERRKVSDIKPITHARDTLMYVVNFSDSKGWVTIAGDKRVEPILSSSLTGYLDLERIGVEGIWYEDLLDRLHVLRSNPKIDTASSNYKRWYALESYARYKEALLSKKELRQFSPDGTYIGLPGEKEEDICIGTLTTVVVDREVKPLVATKWGQSKEWSGKMPDYKTSQGDINGKCAPGCVAVAGGQLLYYLNSKYGKPAEAYTEGGFEGWSNEYGKSCSSDFHGLSKDAFLQMALSRKNSKYPNGFDRVSTFLAYIGDKIDMEYAQESGTRTEMLVDFMRKEYGIESEYSDYSVEKVRKALDDGFPVPIRASADRKKYFGVWRYGNGHAWLIDGYRHSYSRSEHYWVSPEFLRYNPVYLDMDGVFRNPKEEPVHVPHRTSRSEFKVYQWNMNFGWNGEGDDGTYSVSADIWNPNGKHPFQYEKKIIHNIRL